MSKVKTLLVTGGSSDIGKSLIKELTNEYDRIWAHYNNNKEAILELSEGKKEVVVPIKADFSDKEDVKRMIEEIIESGFIPNHIVHLPAIKAHNKPFIKWEDNDYEKEFNVSVYSIINIIRGFIPYMEKNNYGKIVFVLSSFVSGVPPKYQSPYIMSKYALYGLMKNLAAEYSGKSVNINAVSPDMINTKFNDEIARKIKEINADKSPLKRNLEVMDVVPAIKFLLSEKANAISGVNIPITAGIEMV